MLSLIFENFWFWGCIVVTAITVFILAVSSKKYNWIEALIQLGIIVVIVFFVCLFGFFKYRINQWEFWNGRVEEFVYEEPWVEHYPIKHEIKNDKGEVTMSWTTWHDRDHDAEYYVKTVFGKNNITKKDFLKAHNDFGSVHVELEHYQEKKGSDGDAYVSVPTRPINASTINSYNNWVKASELTIYQIQGLEDQVEQLKTRGLIFEYPQLSIGPYGQPYLYRVLHNTDFNFDKMEAELSTYCAVNSDGQNFVRPEGIEAQFNLILYIVNKAPRELLQTLDFYWKGGNKNDTIIILSLDGTKIEWADSISLTRSGQYIANIRDFSGMNIISEQDKLIKKIKDNITYNWERIPMATFEYLKADLVLPFWAQMVAIILCIIGNVILGLIFLNNNLDDERRRYSDNEMRRRYW